MADMYNSACTSSSSSPTEPDDFSLFLHQILLRSSQSSSQPNPPHYPPPHIPNSIPSSLLTISETQIPGSSFSFGNVLSAPDAGYFQSTGPHLSSSSAGGAIDTEEYDSEEGFEALAEGMPATKSAPSRGSSKRTRAAEVHNMSEKRRRSRINEKMKALQNLIPNSNKSDKASMLDEAIEYLKQLQLQVQMLTMKNGLSLYPMFHPGILQSGQLERTKIDLYQDNLALNKNIPENGLLNMSNQCTKQFQPSGVPCPIQGHGVPFHHLLQEPLKDDGNLAPPKLPGNHQEAKPLGSVNAVETCIVGTERRETFFPSHVECDAIFGSHLNDLCSDRKPPVSGMESRRLNF